MMKSIPQIGITMGDPAGIGPEIILKAYQKRLPSHFPVLFGDLHIIREFESSVSPKKIHIIKTLDESLIPNREGINLLPVTELPLGSIHPGHVNAATGKAAGQYIETAIKAVLRHQIDAVVTCPIHKQAFHLGGYPFPGHTEMFATLTGTKRFGMMMASAPIKVSLVTIHLPLKKIPQYLTKERLEEIISLTLNTLHQWFGIPDPEICVLGLNPHAGEGGDMGEEENKIIHPVVREFLEKGTRITGPLPADTAFTKKNLKRFDTFIAMYHDQGLIPFKLLAFETGVNITMGLPFPRVSVDHGTGLDIAGKGIADPRSLRSAIRWAIKFVRLKVGNFTFHF